ncbi:receptor-type tyrosine-protein phosphatase N2 isoform X4 [Prionailurus bengalensis]|uniref:receptor-type tyrosine-protein phosphatase N2 isoform X4 n=1 Tax=Prionailurus bengalensis TaxID=37029 RepID=UPI001CAA1E0D|nr:receptor-type tyrosine-protein phosphatase N2 isoform X4 [Prionailurus bengalensis]
MGPLLALLLLLLLPPPRTAPAPRTRQLPGLLGCLFEDGLCRPSETCVNDGVFGRCQKVPAVDTHRYEVSPAVLQHLAATLQKLSRTGFTWQDDYTQHVMAQELLNLPSPQHLDASSTARTSKQSVDEDRRSGLEDDGGLARAVQRYLPYLEALSQAVAPNVRLRTKHNRPPAQGEDPLADSVLTFMAQTSALTYAPGPGADYPGGRPLRTPGRLQPDELSPKVDGNVNRQKLIAALGAYAARKPPVPHGEGDPWPRNPLHAPWKTPRVLSAPVEPRKWPSPPGGPKPPEAMSDETLIQSLLKDLGEQPDLGQVARAIASAMQAVGAEGEPRGAEKGAAGKPRESDVGRPGGGVPDDRVPDGGGRAYEEVSRLSLELGDHLPDPGSQLSPAVPPLSEPFKVEAKKSEAAEAPPTWEEESAGVENVRSQTYSKERLQRPPPAEPGTGGFGEFRPWVPRPSQEDAHLTAGAQGRPTEELRLEVKPSQEDHGYIVTGTDPLSPEKGKELMEGVAQLLEVPMSVFADIVVVGPAVTFRLSASVQNLTTGDVAQAAVDNKDKLEKASGLEILQAGSGSKSKLKLPPRRAKQGDSTPFIVLTLVSVVAMVGVLLASGVIYCLRHTSRARLQDKVSGPGDHPGPDATAAYQAYMEDHLKNKNRLEKEWEALCAYQAEPNSSLVAQRAENAHKNRSPAVLTYDHSRVLLRSENSHSRSDYINASPIMDHDPRNPAYIATQGPLPATVADFWQMVWESGCVVIVMLTSLSENGICQCCHYWPDEGSSLYHVYEVNLVSEHIWCEDFLVRSFYLKNLQTNETRTVTQFHFLSWCDRGVPSSARSLLDFRRKVNKCYRGRSCPIIVHCSDGAGRSGTYVLIDMVLNKMAKGAKEIDIAATLEHLRDQRPGMVQTKGQFEFALTAVAEEVNAILRALPQ